MERPGQFIYHEEHEVHERQTASFVGFVPFVVEINFSVKSVETLGRIIRNISKKPSTLSLNFENISNLFFWKGQSRVRFWSLAQGR
jgi:hypothetical protein